MKHLTLITLFCLLTWKSNAQEEHKSEDKHSIGLSFSMANIPIADPEATPFKVWAPTIGIEYEIKINDKWDIGILSDIELITYELKGELNKDGTYLERENAWVNTLALFYHPNEHIRLFFGPGYEIEKHRNFFVSSFGLGYHMHKGNYSLMPFFRIDLKGLYYSTAFGFTVGTSFK